MVRRFKNLPFAPVMLMISNTKFIVKNIFVRDIWLSPDVTQINLKIFGRKFFLPQKMESYLFCRVRNHKLNLLAQKTYFLVTSNFKQDLQ